MKTLIILMGVIMLNIQSHAQIHGQSVVCFNGTYTYSIDSIACFASWSVQPPSAGTILSQGLFSATIKWVSSGTVNAGCSSLSVNLDSPLSGSVTGLSTIACGSPAGYQVSYVASTTGSNIFWTLPAGWTLTSGTLNSSQIWVHPSASNGTISYTALSPAGCIYTFSKAITHYSTTGPLTISSTTGPASLCEPASGNYTAFANGASGYAWTFATSTGTVLATGSGVILSSGYSSYTVFPGNPGSYRVKVQALAPAGCSQSNSSVVTMSLNYLASGSPQCGGGHNRMASDIPEIVDERETQSSGVNAYPIPADHSLHVSLGTLTGPAKIIIKDINSNSKLEIQTQNSENDVDISALSNGLYVLEVQNGVEFKRQKVLIRH